MGGGLPREVSARLCLPRGCLPGRCLPREVSAQEGVCLGGGGVSVADVKNAVYNLTTDNDVRKNKQKLLLCVFILKYDFTINFYNCMFSRYNTYIGTS